MIKTIQVYLSTLMSKRKLIQQFVPYEINETINGEYKINHMVLDRSIKVNGQAILGERVLVKEKIIINGSLVTRHANFESDLIAHGTASVIDSKVKGPAIFSGCLSAKNSSFTNSIQLVTKKSEFDHCQIDNITVQALPFKNSVQKIWLTNGTVITGDILFQSGTGKVYVDASSVIKGHLVGGVLIKE